MLLLPMSQKSGRKIGQFCGERCPLIARAVIHAVPSYRGGGCRVLLIVWMLLSHTPLSVCLIPGLVIHGVDATFFFWNYIIAQIMLKEGEATSCQANTCFKDFIEHSPKFLYVTQACLLPHLA